MVCGDIPEAQVSLCYKKRQYLMARVIQRQNLARHLRELAIVKTGVLNRLHQTRHYIPPLNLATGKNILAEVSSTKKSDNSKLINWFSTPVISPRAFQYPAPSYQNVLKIWRKQFDCDGNKSILNEGFKLDGNSCIQKW